MNEIEDNGKKVFWTCGTRVCPVCMQPVTYQSGRTIGKDVYHHRCVKIAYGVLRLYVIIIALAAAAGYLAYLQFL
jgi:hypothetical protein